MISYLKIESFLLLNLSAGHKVPGHSLENLWNKKSTI